MNTTFRLVGSHTTHCKENAWVDFPIYRFCSISIAFCLCPSKWRFCFCYCYCSQSFNIISCHQSIFLNIILFPSRNYNSKLMTYELFKGHLLHPLHYLLTLSKFWDVGTRYCIVFILSHNWHSSGLGFCFWPRTYYVHTHALRGHYRQEGIILPELGYICIKTPILSVIVQ